MELVALDVQHADRFSVRHQGKRSFVRTVRFRLRAASQPVNYESVTTGPAPASGPAGALRAPWLSVRGLTAGLRARFE